MRQRRALHSALRFREGNRKIPVDAFRDARRRGARLGRRPHGRARACARIARRSRQRPRRGRRRRLRIHIYNSRRAAHGHIRRETQPGFRGLRFARARDTRTRGFVPARHERELRRRCGRRPRRNDLRARRRGYDALVRDGLDRGGDRRDAARPMRRGGACDEPGRRERREARAL